MRLGHVDGIRNGVRTHVAARGRVSSGGELSVKLTRCHRRNGEVRSRLPLGQAADRQVSLTLERG